MEEVEAAKNVTHKILDLDEFPLSQLGFLLPVNSTIREVRELFDHWFKTYQENG